MKLKTIRQFGDSLCEHMTTDLDLSQCSICSHTEQPIREKCLVMLIQLDSETIR